MGGHNEKDVSSNKLILRDYANKAFDAGDIGEVILSGPKLWFNTGSKWEIITSA